jgi:RecA-family ATPase
MLLTGPAGVGKTQFSLRVAINLALGRDFIDMKVERPCRILFWSLEMGHMDLKYFISTMAEDFNDEELMLLEQNLIIAPVGEAFYLDNAKGQQQFREIVDSLNVDGVFIDSVGSTTSGSISDEGTVKTLMDFNDSLRQSLGIFTWYIHHNRKAQGDNKKPNKLADVYGNQYLVNRATSVYCLWPNNKSIEVIPLKKRLAAVEDSWTISRVGNLDFKKGSNMTILQGGKDDDGLDLDENDPPNTDLGGF